MDDPNRDEVPALFPVAGFFFGILALIGWVLVPLGLPLALLGLYFSVRGLKSAKKGLARLAVLFSAIGLFLTVGNFGIACYVHFTGKPRVLKEWMDQVSAAAHRQRVKSPH